MIKILERKSKKDIKPYYLLVYKYMIGDANGNTTEEVKVSLENPHIERYVTLLNSLKPTKGTWGLILDQETLKKVFKEGQITEDDFDFLKKTMYEDYDENELNSDKKKDKFLCSFFEGVRSEMEYSFLVFKGIDLFYINEKGLKLETKIV